MRILLNLLVLLPFFISAQSLGDRVEAEYSIKEIGYDGKQSLVVGKVFFDGRNKTLTHTQSFPSENLFTFRDSTILLVSDDSVVMGSSSALSIELSIYNLILENRVSDLGLREKGFKLINVENEGDKVVSQWVYPGKVDFGTIMTIHKAGYLEGLVFYDQVGNALLKQYFKDYQKIGTVFFPSKIYESTFTPQGENRKITTHRNIKVNDYSDEDNFYSLFSNAYNRLIRSTEN